MGKPRRAPRHLAGGAQGEGEAKDEIHPIHEAQLLTYLRLTHITVGLLLNFNVTAPKHGIVRRVL